MTPEAQAFLSNLKDFFGDTADGEGGGEKTFPFPIMEKPIREGSSMTWREVTIAMIKSISGSCERCKNLLDVSEEKFCVECSFMQNRTDDY